MTNNKDREDAKQFKSPIFLVYDSNNEWKKKFNLLSTAQVLQNEIKFDDNFFLIF